MQQLDNPIWESLSTRHTALGGGDDFAKRFHPDISPLAGTRDQSVEAYASLARMLGRGEKARFFLASPRTYPQEWKIIFEANLAQMVCNDPVKTSHNHKIESLAKAQVPEMLALTSLINPGPFGTRTIELGNYFGIFNEGRLAAMAGERLRIPGYTEVSAVCTHPDHRGQGYATALISHVMEGITKRGDIPILHSLAENAAAMGVYERLGFRTRCILNYSIVEPPEA